MKLNINNILNIKENNHFIMIILFFYVQLTFFKIRLDLNQEIKNLLFFKKIFNIIVFNNTKIWVC
jgi:hypothetical protein